MSAHWKKLGNTGCRDIKKKLSKLEITIHDKGNSGKTMEHTVCLRLALGTSEFTANINKHFYYKY